MKPMYLFLRITLPYVMRIFFRRILTLNSQKTFRTRTIFVSNHPSAFLDPLVAGNFQRAIFYFMVRSDVFKPWLRPITWASHMVPIYRLLEDGKESLEKNNESFSEAIKILKNNHSLIMFGEGYTDNVFIRSLKPIKKGPARIAFSAMVATDWKLDILVQPTGLNYAHPKYFRSDIVLSFGKIINLLDYKELYLENPAKAQTKLIRDIEKQIQSQITYVHDKSLAPFVENIQIITHKGMNHLHHDDRIPLTERYHYSKKVASFVNENYNAENENWKELNSGLSQYFIDQKKEKVNENWVYQFEKSKNKNFAFRFLYLIFLFPVFLVGLIHNLIPYLLVKFFVEKTFKRDVFWSGVKLLLGAPIFTLYNLPAIWLFHHYVYESYLLGIAYLLIVPAISLVIGHGYFEKLKDTIKILKTPKTLIEKFAVRRKILLDKISKIGLGF